MKATRTYQIATYKLGGEYAVLGQAVYSDLKQAKQIASRQAMDRGMPTQVLRNDSVVVFNSSGAKK